MQDTVDNTSRLPARQGAFNVAPAPCTAPRGHEVAVRRRAVAIHPIERYFQAIGSFVLVAAR